MDVQIPHQEIGGPAQGLMIEGHVGGDPDLVLGLEGGQDLDLGPEGDQGPVLALVVVILGQDQGLVAAHVLVPDQGPGPSQGQDLDQSRLWMTTKNQGRDRQVKKNQDLNLLWKLRMEEQKKGSVQNLAPDLDQSLALSQDLVLENVQHLEVDLDLKVLSKTVNLFIYLNLMSKDIQPRGICLLHILKICILKHLPKDYIYKTT